MPKKIRQCPKCGSHDVEPDLSAHAFGSGTVFNRYKCRKCGYTGIFFLEVDKKAFRSKAKKTKAL